MTKKITVIAKGNFGHHRLFGQIVEGQSYIIDADKFAPALFHAPTCTEPSQEGESASTDQPPTTSKKKRS